MQEIVKVADLALSRLASSPQQLVLERIRQAYRLFHRRQTLAGRCVEKDLVLSFVRGQICG
jgi:hypothetical protein